MRETKTQHFKVQYFGFWKNEKIISRIETLNTLLEADSATLKNPNKKNGIMRKTYNGEKGICGNPITQGTTHTEQ